MENKKASSSDNIINVAVVNFSAIWGNKQKNLLSICEYIKTASDNKAQIIVFPELALTGYSYDKDNNNNLKMHQKESEVIPGASVTKITEYTKKYKIYAIFGMPERNDDTLYNSAVVCGPEGYIGTYRKIHPFGDENYWASEGNEPFLFDTKWGKVGIGICHDSFAFPELTRYYASSGARLYLNLSALQNINTWDDYYLTTLKNIVMTGGMYVASSNLTGKDSGAVFPGGSIILGPNLNWMLKDAEYCTVYAGDINNSAEEVFVATIDLSKVTNEIYINNKITGKPDFRPELYANWYRGLANKSKKS